MTTSTTTLSDPYAVVLDIGASKTYWGYSGDSEPRQCHTSAWCTNQKTNELSVVAEFLELRKGYTPSWMMHYNRLPEPLDQYIKLRDTETVVELDKTSLTGKLDSDLLHRSLKHINEALDEDALKDRALFFTEPTKRSLSQMKTTAEVAFEKVGAGAISSARKAALSAFALGRLTACVCELGPLSASITPVYEGYTLQKNIQQYAVGGYFLDWMLASAMHLWDNTNHSFDVKFMPFPTKDKAMKFYGMRGSARTAVAEEASILEGVNPYYLHHSRARVVQDFKECVLSVKESRNGSGIMSEAQRMKAAGRGRPGDGSMRDSPRDAEVADDLSYELPDGKVLYVNDAISTGIPEFLFSPLEAVVARNFLAPFADQLGPLIRKFPGIPTAIVSNAFSCDVDLRPVLLQNIVIAGGGATLEGLTERVATDLTRMTHVDVGPRDYLSADAAMNSNNTLRDVSSFKFKIAARIPYERSYTSWIGASVLSNLSSYNTLWISKSEWAEIGSNILERRAVF